MSNRNLTWYVALLVLGVGTPASISQTSSIALRCVGEVSLGASSVAMADHKQMETSGGTKLFDVSVGEAADGDSFQCSFIVPADYDDGGTAAPPRMRFYGWVPAAQFAGLNGCSEPDEVQWDIYWREGIDATSTGSSETQTDATNTETLSCLACGGTYCFTAETWNEFFGDITNAASDWTPGDLIVVRPKRQTGGSNYKLTYLVWLAAVEIEYDSTN